MAAFRIVFVRDDTERSETITASFNDLDQALSVMEARGLRVLYIAEKREGEESQRLEPPAAQRLTAAKPARSRSFPLRRFSARAIA